MDDLILEIWGYDISGDESQYSVIKDCLFKENIGNTVSAINVDESKLSLFGSNDDDNFSLNLSVQGSTIFARFSNITS